MTLKCSVALVIRDVARTDAVLLVQRPDDDEDLPGVWGLPAASLMGAETWHAAAARAAREKLGVDVDILRTLNEGSRERERYTLQMRLLEAVLQTGEPRLDGPLPPGTTRYQAWKWGSVRDLEPAAQRGSLCSILALDALSSG